MDDNRNKKLEFEEFRKGITEYGLNYSKDEIKEIFNIFDKDNSGTIDFEEFLERLRVILYKSRALKLLKIFNIFALASNGQM